MSKKQIPVGVAIFLMLTFSSCTCIYFNTFHNIRKNFNAAEKSRSRGGRDFARGAEVKQYTDAITKASRVLERHPTSSWVDDALYIIGTSYYYLEDYSKAARKFKELFANYPESEYVSRARVLMAKAKLMMNEEAEAVVIFERIFDEEEDRKMKADAARSLGEYYFENKDYENANRYFMSLIDSLGDEKDRLSALVYVADGYFDIFSFPRALEKYQQALEHNPDTLQHYHITYRLSECDFFMNRISEGLDRLSELADNELYYDSLAPIKLKMAEGYEWEGDFNSAVDTYEQITVENPRLEAAAVAYYRLGLIYQYDFEDLEKARAYYQKSREEKSNSAVAEDATRRASKLALLQQYSRAEDAGLPDDSAQQLDQSQLDNLSEDLFLLGELFYFDLEKPDSAISAFQALLDRYPASRYAPRALISMSYIYRDEFVDSAASDSLLRRVLKEYPRYDEAEDVINTLGLAGTVADTGYAAIPFARADRFLEQFRELDSSLYYVRLAIDSIMAAEGAARDSLASDTLEKSDSLQVPDSLDIEDLYLMGDTLLAPDTGGAPMLPSPQTSQATEPARISGRELLARDREIADSLRRADSIRVADSLRAVELARMADSLRSVRQQQRDSIGEPSATLRPQPPPDSMMFPDTLSLAQMVAMAQDTLSRENDTMVDSSIVGPPTPTTRLTPEQDTSAVPPEVGPPVDTSGPIGGENLLESLRRQALESGAKPRKGADLSLPAVSDSGQMEDTMQAADTGLAPDTGQVAEADQAADTIEIVQKELFEYWREAFDSAREKFSPRQAELLDSAGYYYRYVIDSFPFSRYSVQSRYVLLWTYDRYLAPGDSVLMDLYRGFVDSFPQSEYAQAIADEYNITTVGMVRQQQQQQQQQVDEQEALADTGQAADTAAEGAGQSEIPPDVPIVDSKYITGTNGEILEPAKKYFLQHDIPFEYPLEALATGIEDNLYFQIRIDFSGKVVETVLMNPTESPELNEQAERTVKNSRFDAGRIPPELYDNWFYYVLEVRIPAHLRQ